VCLALESVETGVISEIIVSEYDAGNGWNGREKENC